MLQLTTVSVGGLRMRELQKEASDIEQTVDAASAGAKITFDAMLERAQSQLQRTLGATEVSVASVIQKQVQDAEIKTQQLMDKLRHEAESSTRIRTQQDVARAIETLQTGLKELLATTQIQTSALAESIQDNVCKEAEATYHEHFEDILKRSKAALAEAVSVVEIKARTLAQGQANLTHEETHHRLEQIRKDTEVAVRTQTQADVQQVIANLKQTMAEVCSNAKSCLEEIAVGVTENARQNKANEGHPT
ncbi:hypothetical protein BBJ28_00025491 [Nothophytophthora sp. Chile5]|nr:hypothetical protein BBJ28_00025491 [Nothophytophthora sp. Chile5]